MTFLGIFVGMVTGIISNTALWAVQYNKLVKKEEMSTAIKGASEPEFRLPPTIAGAILVPIGLFGMRISCLPLHLKYADGYCAQGFAWTTYPWVSGVVRGQS